MNINPMAFVDNLYYMGMGMLCILIVMGVIDQITNMRGLRPPLTPRTNQEE